MHARQQLYVLIMDLELHRTSRNVTPTTAGVHALAEARQVLAAADNLVTEATTGHTRLRIGHPWAAMGRHTPVLRTCRR